MKQELREMLDQCTEELNDIGERISTLSPLDKVRRYFTNYALIKACGTVEFVYRSIVADYFSQLSNNRIDTYLDETIRKGSMSAKYDMMKNLLGKFDEQWKKDFQNAVGSASNKNQMIDASNSLVNNRNTFAHGKSPTATFLEIKQYYADVVQLIQIFDDIVC